MIPEQQNISVGAQEQNFAAGEKHSAVVTTGEQKKICNCHCKTAEVSPKTE